MVRREIKKFELVVPTGGYECYIPCSVKSVISAAACIALGAWARQIGRASCRERV